MEQIEKNTVRAENQLRPTDYVTFSGTEKHGLRITFAGNSITRHGVKEDIGWYWDHGMAASSREKDYVHLLESRVLRETDATFCICQVAEWERNYRRGSETFGYYAAARDFCPDILVMRAVENCPSKDFDPDAFRAEYEKLIDFLGGGRAKVILTTGFWKHVGDPQIRLAAQERNYPLVELGDLGELDEMKATGLFAHQGVASHPGDRGMQEIADRLWKEMRPIFAKTK